MSDKQQWQTYRFEQIAANINERVDDPSKAGVDRYVGLEHLDPDSLKIRRWGSPSDVEATKLRFYPGDIVFARRRAYQRKLGVAEFEGICSAHAMVLRAKPEVILPEFLPFFIQSDLFMDRAIEISVGSLSPTVNWKTLAAQEFALPPLDEQRRLADVLAASAVAQDALLALQDSASAMWNTLASYYFGGEDVTLRDCLKIKLDQCLVYSSDGPFGSKLKTEHYSTSGVQVIRLQNIQWRTFNRQDKAYIDEGYFQAELSRYAVHPGDIVVAGLGDDSVPAGRACIIPKDIGPAINKADCYCLRASEKLEQNYLVAFLNSPQGLAQSSAFAQGTTRYRLNLNNIRRMRLPLPELNVQRRIVEYLESIRQAETLAISRHHAARIQHGEILNSMLYLT